MPKNRSNRSKKLARQNKARTSRNMPPLPQLVATPAEARAAIEHASAVGHFAIAGPDGETRPVTVQQISDWHNAGLASDGEPPLEPGELTEMLLDDFMFGRLRRRTDGLWESDDDYMNAGGQA